MRVNLFNPATNQTKQIKLGFSWTVFFFGGFPALFRGDIKWFLIALVIGVVLGIPTFGIGTGLFGIVFAFFYNNLYAKDLIAAGFEPADEASRNMLLSKNITV
ncbi:DUF2628 domain-containing protein [Convivina intestini]|uniref:DUF2628 domain-containing protein n=1 Tax=Convivina intestini TaxID=1505726 RepID=UPI00200C0F80|nr:DUF2628 domain-containing protein [Convivina intestini]CAH1852493.1 hypothetical protein R078131_00488 [Convivina intestini]